MSQSGLGLDELLRRATGEFVHQRHSLQSNNLAVSASVESQQYIELFWLHLTHAIQSDPEHLGLSLIKTGNAEPVSFQHYFQRITATKDLDDSQFMRVASVLASVLTMADVLSDVTEKFAVSLQSESHIGLPFDVMSERFVSLRTLLSAKGYADETSGNAPTLIMGGTDTAIKFYWNLLLRAANAFYELEERDPTREEMEALWEGSRELIFRIGSGSLTAFVALASACTDTASAPLWANTIDLSLVRNGDVYEWIVNESFEQRFNNVFSKIKAKQQGEFVGCAALYTRVERLPLSVEASREQSLGDSTAFSELIRWIDTVARVHYFSKFPSCGG